MNAISSKDIPATWKDNAEYPDVICHCRFKHLTGQIKDNAEYCVLICHYLLEHLTGQLICVIGEPFVLPYCFVWKQDTH